MLIHLQHDYELCLIVRMLLVIYMIAFTSLLSAVTFQLTSPLFHYVSPNPKKISVKK